MAIFLLRSISLLPHAAMMKIGVLIGNFLHTLMTSRRHIAEVNIQLCFPDLSQYEVENLVKEHFKYLGTGLMDLAIAWWWSDRRIESLNIKVHGLETLNTHPTQGTIFLAAHFTSLELSGRLLGKYADFYGMYRPQENPVIQHHYEKYRTRYSLGMVTKFDVKPSIKALKSNKGIWFAPDQNFKGKGFIYSTFFGVPAATNTATSRFAKLAQAKVQPFALFSTPKGYELCFEKTLSEITGENIERETQLMNDTYEKWVLEHIPQYNWIHKRFKDQPNGISPY